MCWIAVVIGASAWIVGLWQLATGNSVGGAGLMIGGGVVAAVAFMMVRRGSGGVAEAITELISEFMHRG